MPNGALQVSPNSAACVVPRVMPGSTRVTKAWRSNARAFARSEASRSTPPET